MQSKSWVPLYLLIWITSNFTAIDMVSIMFAAISMVNFQCLCEPAFDWVKSTWFAGLQCTLLCRHVHVIFYDENISICESTCRDAKETTWEACTDVLIDALPLRVSVTHTYSFDVGRPAAGVHYRSARLVQWDRHSGICYKPTQPHFNPCLSSVSTQLIHQMC